MGSELMTDNSYLYPRPTPFLPYKNLEISNLPVVSLFTDPVPRHPIFFHFSFFSFYYFLFDRLVSKHNSILVCLSARKAHDYPLPLCLWWTLPWENTLLSTYTKHGAATRREAFDLYWAIFLKDKNGKSGAHSHTNLTINSISEEFPEYFQTLP